MRWTRGVCALSPVVEVKPDVLLRDGGSQVAMLASRLAGCWKARPGRMALERWIVDVDVVARSRGGAHAVPADLDLTAVAERRSSRCAGGGCGLHLALIGYEPR